MSHSFRKTRTKDKRDRHARGGRPPELTPDGAVMHYSHKCMGGVRADPPMALPCFRCHGAGCSACTDDDGLPL